VLCPFIVVVLSVAAAGTAASRGNSANMLCSFGPRNKVAFLPQFPSFRKNNARVKNRERTNINYLELSKNNKNPGDNHKDAASNIRTEGDSYYNLSSSGVSSQRGKIHKIWDEYPLRTFENRTSSSSHPVDHHHHRQKKNKSSNHTKESSPSLEVLKMKENNTSNQEKEEEVGGYFDIFAPDLILQPSANTSSSSFDLEKALEILGPLTISEPSLGIEFGSNSSSKKLSSYKSRTPYAPPALLNPHKFFSMGRLKLPLLSIDEAESINNTQVADDSSNKNTTISSPAPANATAPPPPPNNDTFPATIITIPYNIYDPSAALAFIDSQANFTKQQLDAAQKLLFEYSTNATKQLDSAQRAFLEAIAGQAQVSEAASRSYANGKPVPASSASSSSIVKPKTTTLSMDELEAYLRLNGYVRRDELEGSPPPSSSSVAAMPLQVGRGRRKAMTRGRNEPKTFEAVIPSSDAVTASSETRSSGRGGGRVAFPQPSILSYAKLKWGSTVASSFLGILGSVSVLPNLWLIGAVFGALYGYETSKNLAQRPPSNALSNLVVYLGRELTKTYLKIYDFWTGLWFMYKTGQLSYEYWKRYAALDEQFAIQSKIDAWNARFQKGKENFDRWEQENEVGRKILAGLRTVWLVEENALKKRSMKKKSRYRVVQWCYDATRYIRLRLVAIYSKRGKVVEDAQALLNGMRQNFFDAELWKESLGARIAAALAALTFVNLTGVLFSVSPLLLGALAVMLGGFVWPEWFSEWLSQMNNFLEVTKAKGRGEKLMNKAKGQGKEVMNKFKLGSSTTNLPTTRKNPTTTKKKTPSSSSSWSFSWPFGDKRNKERYHFFQRQDGSKRWYRTGGNPWNANNNLSNLWGQPKQQEEKPWWSLKS
jgi:hypothetical protein